MKTKRDLTYEKPKGMIDYDLRSKASMDLAKILKIDAGSDSHQEIWNHLNYLTELYLESDKFKEQISATAANDHLNAAMKSLKAAVREFKGLDPLNVVHLDGHYSQLAENAPPNGATDRFISEACLMIEAIDSARENPIKTAGSSQLRYERGLWDIATLFRKHFPNYAISRKQSSLYYKVVKFWYSDMLHLSITDPGGHIKVFIDGEGSVFK